MRDIPSFLLRRSADLKDDLEGMRQALQDNSARQEALRSERDDYLFSILCMEQELESIERGEIVVVVNKPSPMEVPPRVLEKTMAENMASLLALLTERKKKDQAENKGKNYEGYMSAEVLARRSRISAQSVYWPLRRLLANHQVETDGGGFWRIASPGSR